MNESISFEIVATFLSESKKIDAVLKKKEKPPRLKTAPLYNLRIRNKWGRKGGQRETKPDQVLIPATHTQSSWQIGFQVKCLRSTLRLSFAVQKCAQYWSWWSTMIYFGRTADRPFVGRRPIRGPHFQRPFSPHSTSVFQYIKVSASRGTPWLRNLWRCSASAIGFSSRSQDFISRKIRWAGRASLRTAAAN